jgi:hypothetical protein
MLVPPYNVYRREHRFIQACLSIEDKTRVILAIRKNDSITVPCCKSVWMGEYAGDRIRIDTKEILPITTIFRKNRMMIFL